tara:strand:- start:4642 stop:5250 length:609 start_codon:yes stop_codon:yes gene_type:complete
MTSFIERMQVIANDKEEVQKSIYAAHIKNVELRKDQLFKKLTYKYYDKIKNTIQNASKFGRQYAYINFEYNDFKANINGLGNPSQIQKMWLKELCNQDSKYLNYYRPFHRVTGNIVLGDYSDPENMWHFDSGNYVFPRNPSIFPDSNPKRRESFKGLNFDVWNNAKFTTVFSWDDKVGYDMRYYYKSSEQNRENDLDSIGLT